MAGEEQIQGPGLKIAVERLWLWVHPGEPGLYALPGAGAMLAANTQGPISSLVLMMELTGQARAFALPMLAATRDRAPDRAALGL